jgi:hypothetical protein
MSVETTFGNLFKPEVRTSGRKLYAQDKISLSSHSDTAVTAYVRVAPPFKVTLTAQDISSTSFDSDCSCPVAKKSRFCKHVWGTLLCVEEKHPDFLLAKTDIQKNEVSFAATEPSAKTTYQETAKQRASDYRKDQYQKQKARLKEKKQGSKAPANANDSNSYSPEVSAAMAYFELNGFAMTAGPSKEILADAKRTLSRVFHPDKGGSHEESVELNYHCEIISEFIVKYA